MWPWGHLAVGYLCYSAWTRVRSGRDPVGVETVVVALGTQFPDLIDKPLAWTFELLPSGRSLAHSLLTAVPITLLTFWLCRREDRESVGVAFAVGYLSHMFVDGIPALLDGAFEYVTYLVWPLLPPPPYEMDASFAEHFRHLEPTPYFLGQLALFALAVGVWARQGWPGVETLFGWHREPGERT